MRNVVILYNIISIDKAFYWECSALVSSHRRSVHLPKTTPGFNSLLPLFVAGKVLFFLENLDSSRGCHSLQDIGAGKGKYYAVNIPLRDGMDDDSYESIFVPIITKVMETFQPSAVVLQCGADSLTGDRLGCFNLTVKGTFSVRVDTCR